MEVLGKYTEIAGILAEIAALWLMVKLLFGLLNCFLGYKLLKFWVAGCGFLIGLLGGLAAGSIFSDKTGVILAAGAGCGVVLGVLAYEIYLVGAFLLGWLMTVSACFSVKNLIEMNDKTELLLLAFGAVAGIGVGALIVKFARPSIILSTAISGGISVASGITGLLKWDNPLYMLGMGAAFSVCGMIFQWNTTKKME
ncbi:MAG: hypothetical protein KH828_12130 [Clostridiales bacterium]|nr:hypothetical protein [Clostridiales bacterium]